MKIKNNNKCELKFVGLENLLKIMRIKKLAYNVKLKLKTSFV